MRRVLLTLLAAALALTACTSAGGSNADFRFHDATPVSTLIPQQDRKPAADFSGPLLSGGTARISDAKGSPLLVNFWASWCGPCQTETPQFDSLYRSVKAKGVKFLGIDTKDDKGSAQGFVARNQISYPIVFDQQGKGALVLGNIPAGLPFTVLIDKQGRVAAVYIARLSPKDLAGPLDRLLAET